MDLTSNRYALRGGKWGYDRLLVLSRERWPDTRRFLRRAGLSPGMRCVDLGCGGGEVTLEIARMVAPGGFAVGVDLDKVKLELARKAAADRGTANIEFREESVLEWHGDEAYDVVYSRFLLHHLSEPVRLVRKMWDAVRPGGCLAIEDADHGGWSVDPPDPGFDFFLRNLHEVIRRAGGDASFGRRLYRCFLDAGIRTPLATLVAPLRIRGEGKIMASLTLESIAESIISEGLASATQVHEAIESLAQVTKRRDSLFCGPRIFQVLARKSAE